MLTHKKEHKLVRSHAQGLSRIIEIGLGIIRHQIASVVHNLHVTVEPVIPDNINHRSLRHPHLVSLVVEIHYIFNKFIHHQIALDDSGKVIPVLGMEGCNERNLLCFCHSGRKSAGRERCVGVNNPETLAVHLAQSPRINLWNACDIWMAERNRH